MTATDIQSLLGAYQVALLSLLVLCLVQLTQALMTAPLAFVSGAQTPGVPIRGDHTALSFRVLRTHANSVENLAPFGLAVLVAIAVTVDARWVNGLALGHLAARLLFWIVYYLGVGAVAGGPRTIAFVGGMFTNLALITMAIYQLLQIWQ